MRSIGPGKLTKYVGITKDSALPGILRAGMDPLEKAWPKVEARRWQGMAATLVTVTCKATNYNRPQRKPWPRSLCNCVRLYSIEQGSSNKIKQIKDIYICDYQILGKQGKINRYISYISTSMSLSASFSFVSSRILRSFSSSHRLCQKFCRASRASLSASRIICPLSFL